VSSNSSVCSNDSLASAATGAAVRSPAPQTRRGPPGASACTPARTERPSGVVEPASDSPITSSTRSLVVATTSSGRSAKERPATQAATSLASAVLAGTGSLTPLLRFEMLQRPRQERRRQQEPAEHDLTDGEAAGVIAQETDD